MRYDLKLVTARKVLANLKEEVLYILLDTETYQYCSNRMVLPWLEEDAEYAIKKIKLKSKDEQFYIRKIHNILGVYSEDIPMLNRRRNMIKRRLKRKGKIA